MITPHCLDNDKKFAAMIDNMVCQPGYKQHDLAVGLSLHTYPIGPHTWFGVVDDGMKREIKLFNQAELESFLTGSAPTG